MSFLDIFKIKSYKAEIEQLRKQLDDLCYSDYAGAQEKIKSLNTEAAEKQRIINDLNAEITKLNTERLKVERKLKTAVNKIDKSKEIYNSISYSINNFFDYEPELQSLKLSNDKLNDLEDLSPSIILKLHYMDVKSLKKSFKENDKQIKKIMLQYQGRYTTKANRTIYELMVIALRAELQNILYNLKFEKLDKAIEQVKTVTKKYLDIATQGNKSIATTLTKFIGEIEYLFINAVKIEYNYYVKKEQARQEQLALREQMRQEAEERKALEQEKKKIEKEEQKYNNEIEKINEQIKNALDAEKKALKAKILELQAKLSDVIIKKDNIVQLQNGKAGNVYIISNLGSFGDNIFKIGMTRRINPQDRVNELGDASVPFKFDVHSFIFSENAVSLEANIHKRLNSKRVNKVNSRKEFFYSSIDELEQLVNELEPTAEFNKTMMATEFRQSISTDENYTSDYTLDDDDEE